MQKITPHLWFDKEAKAAAALYTSLFPDSKIKSQRTLDDTPSGSVDLVAIELAGQDFRMISAGPLFKFTPAVSFAVACATPQEVDALWKELSQGGSVLLPLGEYPFSRRYGWTQDRYGLSWQIMFMGERPIGQKITPTLMFTGEQSGKAEDAINFYGSVLDGFTIDHILRYGKDEAPEKEGAIKHAAFTLAGQQFAAMDSARVHGFSFNEAISFMVSCETQPEIDRYWERISARPESEQCGWLKDKYGLSWQIVPAIMGQMLEASDPARVARVTAAFLKMKKFDIAKLKEAYEGATESAA
jgi:predicted 3-demethylubiquinone-9 3-methyltransferase (glyoxalase superfamily)